LAAAAAEKAADVMTVMTVMIESVTLALAY
jgi:hypothetical protein